MVKGESLNGYTTILNLIEFPKAIEFNLRVMFPSKSDYGEKMKTKVARRHQITIPEEIRKKARIAVGDVLDISYKRGKIHVEKIDENWDKVMKETKGAWRKHPVFKEMDDAVEIVNWMRGKK